MSFVVDTSALYITFSTSHFPSRGHEDLSRQLQDFPFAVPRLSSDSIFLLWPWMICFMLGIQQYEIFIVDRLKILRRSWSLVKCLSTRSRNCFPTFVLADWQYGGLKKMHFLFLTRLAGDLRGFSWYSRLEMCIPLFSACSYVGLASLKILLSLESELILRSIIPRKELFM